jgi:hypothetical protein
LGDAAIQTLALMCQRASALSLMLAACGGDAPFNPNDVSVVGSWVFSESNTVLGDPTLNPCEIANVPLTISADTLGSTADTLNGGWIGHFGTTGTATCSVPWLPGPQTGTYEFADRDILISRLSDTIRVRLVTNHRLYIGTVVSGNRMTGTLDPSLGRSGRWSAVRTGG